MGTGLGAVLLQAFVFCSVLLGCEVRQGFNLFCPPGVFFEFLDGVSRLIASFFSSRERALYVCVDGFYLSRRVGQT